MLNSSPDFPERGTARGAAEGSPGPAGRDKPVLPGIRRFEIDEVARGQRILCVGGLYLNRVAEGEGEHRLALFVLDLDPMVEAQPALD